MTINTGDKENYMGGDKEKAVDALILYSMYTYLYAIIDSLNSYRIVSSSLP